MIELQRYLTIQELCEFSEQQGHPISPSRLSRLIRNGRLTAVRRAGSYFVTEVEAERFVCTERRPGRPARRVTTAAAAMGLG